VVLLQTASADSAEWFESRQTAEDWQRRAKHWRESVSI